MAVPISRTPAFPFFCHFHVPRTCITCFWTRSQEIFFSKILNRQIRIWGSNLRIFRFEGFPNFWWTLSILIYFLSGRIIKIYWLRPLHHVSLLRPEFLFSPMFADALRWWRGHDRVGRPYLSGLPARCLEEDRTSRCHCQETQVGKNVKNPVPSFLLTCLKCPTRAWPTFDSLARVDFCLTKSHHFTIFKF